MAIARATFLASFSALLNTKGAHGLLMEGMKGLKVLNPEPFSCRTHCHPEGMDAHGHGSDHKGAGCRLRADKAWVTTLPTGKMTPYEAATTAGELLMQANLCYTTCGIVKTDAEEDFKTIGLIPSGSHTGQLKRKTKKSKKHHDHAGYGCENIFDTSYWSWNNDTKLKCCDEDCNNKNKSVTRNETSLFKAKDNDVCSLIQCMGSKEKGVVYEKGSNRERTIETCKWTYSFGNGESQTSRFLNDFPRLKEDLGYTKYAEIGNSFSGLVRRMLQSDKLMPILMSKVDAKKHKKNEKVYTHWLTLKQTWSATKPVKRVKG